ncbi:MAG TPA: hypothetical protein VFY26_15950 [Anaerolineales bacterium]|nr:hypothetical protein [Anaerolineales bacterium]
MTVELDQGHSTIVPALLNGGLSINDIKFTRMDERSSFRKKWLFIVFWLAILVVGYLFITSFIEGFWDDFRNIIVDFALFVFFLIIWMAFFAQFVLPVKTFRDRQKIFDRLRSHLFGSHGPALFIENGEIKEHSGERLKKGPGVVWLDSASAAVTRTATAIKQVLGPGVHFTERGEYIEATRTLDLHTQSQKLGPKENDKPFEGKKENQTDEEYREIQNRRKQVSALTRDGIEVVPDISVTFRVNTGFPKQGKPGSRFGFRTALTKAAERVEAQDKDIISRAILGEGINPYKDPESPEHRVAWNRLPIALAVDVWREYVSRFTLDELFKADQIVPIPPQKLPQPTEDEIDLLSQPILIDPNRRSIQSALASMLREVNKFMNRSIKILERENSAPKNTATIPPFSVLQQGSDEEPPKKTALQVINELVKARLTEPDVDSFDDTGKRGIGQLKSDEFDILTKRGLKVISVSISNLRLSPAIEEQIIKQWSAAWLKNAKMESDLLDRKRNVIETTAREKAHIDYAISLSHEINGYARTRKIDAKGLLKALLIRSRALIRSGEFKDQLRRRMANELQEIEDLIKWVEENGK